MSRDYNAVTEPIVKDVEPPRENPDQCVTVVIPAFNEGPHIAEQIRNVRQVLQETGWHFEVIVVDDGSDDGTGDNARMEGVRVVRNPENLGYGAALKRGIAQAAYDWILILDADGTYPAAAIPTLLDAATDCAMVVGARVGEKVNVPLVRRPAKWILTKLSSYLAGRAFPDLNSGMRMIRKTLVAEHAHILPAGFSFTTTITLAAACNQQEIRYVPVDYHARLGKSKMRAWHTYDFLLLILRTIVLFNPLKVFMPLGAVLAVAGVLKFAYDIVLQDLSESAVLGMLGALMIWSLGLLADQNARLSRKR